MTSLLSISLPTRIGLDIYCARVFKNISLYIRCLQVCDISIEICHFDGKSDIFHINTILDNILVYDSVKIVSAFKKLHGPEFNSSSRVNIFTMIEQAYIQKYANSIECSEIYTLYYRLVHEIKLAQESVKTLCLEDNFPLDNMLKECTKLLDSPQTNEKKIQEILEVVRLECETISNTRQEACKRDLQEAEDIIKNKLSRDEKKITKNKYGQYIYGKHNFVFDMSDHCVIGISNNCGGMYDLDPSHIETCKSYKISYKKVL